LKSHICNFFFLLFPLLLCLYSECLSCHFPTNVRCVSFFDEGFFSVDVGEGHFCHGAAKCRQKERSFISPTSEWWLKYENTACFSLRSVVSNSRCGALYMSVLTQGTPVQPTRMQSHPTLTPVVLIISSTPHTECAYLSPLRNLACSTIPSVRVSSLTGNL